MDLRLLAAPSRRDDEREAIDAVVGAGRDDGRVARADRTRHLLLPALRAAQRRVGWVSAGALGYGRAGSTCRPRRRTASRPSTRCSRSTSGPPRCSTSAPTSRAQLAGRERSPEGAVRVVRASACASARPRRCARSPAPRAAARSSFPPTSRRAARSASRLAPAASGVVDPESLDDYRRRLRRARARARARPGGRHRERRRREAARPRRRRLPHRPKWEAVARQPARPHYLVCNADESEPGHLQGSRADGGATRSRSSRR